MADSSGEVLNAGGRTGGWESYQVHGAHVFTLDPCPEAVLGLPWWLSGKEFTCQCRRYGLNS